MRCAACGLRFRDWHTCPSGNTGTVVMPEVYLPPGYEPPSAAVMNPPSFDVRHLEEAIRAALDELGVPGPGYPAPVANAVGILRRALHIEGSDAGGNMGK